MRVCGPRNRSGKATGCLALALIVAFALGGLTSGARADQPTPDGVWSLLPEHDPAVKAAKPWIRPVAGQALTANLVRLRAVLAGAPLEDGPDARAHPLLLELPDPNGRLQVFSVVESPIMEPGLAAQFPEIKTYVGQGVTDPLATLRADVTMQGFHAQVLSPEGSGGVGGVGGVGGAGGWYIDPYSALDTAHYTSYFRKALVRTDGWSCGTEPGPSLGERGTVGGLSTGPTRRTYRLACACTGEYAAFHGGTAGLAQSAIVTAINRVTGVYEVELCIRLTLVSNNNLIVYTNASTDPYTNTNGSAMLSQNQTTITNRIGSANYDIGHVFSTGGGGIAGLGVVCQSSSKARGVTGSPSPTGDAFWIDYVAHEMGHQFGANHNFQGVTDSCGGGNRNGPTADEPGSGSTIMGYAGICGADDLQAHSDAYFNFISYQEIRSYIDGTSCGTSASTSNSAPTVTVSGGGTIPRGTPFALMANGSDPDGDPITYCWEDRNFGGSTGTTLASPDNGVMPLFRSFGATTSPTRLFPRLATVLSGGTDNDEKYPQVSRSSFRFRVTVRDNRAGGGGVNTADVTLGVTAAAGPFTVTAPPAGTAWTAGTSRTVSWNVANTASAPVNCANVAILLSTDGGNTFPITLLSSTPNNGSAMVNVPDNPTGAGRVKVQSIGNVFYNINAGPITIASGVCTSASIATQPTSQTTCAGSNATFTMAAGGSPPLNYQWRKGSTPVGVNSPTLTISPVTGVDAGNYTCTVNNACGSATTDAVSLAVSSPVQISSGPAPLTRCPGESASFSVAATGDPAPTYQWRKGGSPIAGATGSTYTIDPVSEADSGDYDCVVTNVCGNASSGTAALLVQGGVVFIADPLDETICEGDPVTFFVTVSGGGPFTYQWRLEGVDIPGATGPNYSINPASPLDAGLYDCVVTGGCGSSASGAGLLIVRDWPTFGAQPAPVAACPGTSASFSVTAHGYGPLAYQWRRGGVNIDGATSPTLNIAPVGGADVGNYDCVVTGGCGASTSQAASLSLADGPSISQQPQAQSVCAGGTAAFTVAGAGADGFQWRLGAAALADGPTGSGSTITGAATASLSIAGVGPGDAGGYSCVLSGPCDTLASDAATLTVAPGLVITQQPTAQLVCLGGPLTLTVEATGGDPLGYQWRRNTDPIAGQTGPTLSIAPLGAGDAGVYDCVLTDPCGTATSDPAAISVCLPDYNCSGVVSVQDIFDYLASYFAGEARADVNASGVNSVQDIFDFLAVYFAGCP